MTCIICGTISKITITCGICGHDTCFACNQVIVNKYNQPTCRYCAIPELQKEYEDIEEPIPEGSTIEVMRAGTGSIITRVVNDGVYPGDLVTSDNGRFTYDDEHLDLADTMSEVLGVVLGRVKKEGE